MTEVGERPKRRNPIQWHGRRPEGGFAQLPNALLRDKHLSVYARCAAGLLYTHAGGFEVSAVSLAEAMNCSRPTATKALNQLQEARWLVIVESRTARGTRAYSTYHLHRSRPFSDEEFTLLSTGRKAVNELSPQEPTADRSVPVANEAALSLIQVCLPWAPGQIHRNLLAIVDGLLNEGQPKAWIAAGLMRWGSRSDAKPGLLPFLVSDVIRERQAEIFEPIGEARATGNMQPMIELGYRWETPDLPNEMKSARAIRDFMMVKKNAWLDRVAADLERKWLEQLQVKMREMNPALELSDVATVFAG